MPLPESCEEAFASASSTAARMPSLLRVAPETASTPSVPLAARMLSNSLTASAQYFGVSLLEMFSICVILPSAIVTDSVISPLRPVPVPVYVPSTLEASAFAACAGSASRENTMAKQSSRLSSFGMDRVAVCFMFVQTPFLSCEDSRSSCRADGTDFPRQLDVSNPSAKKKDIPPA